MARMRLAGRGDQRGRGSDRGEPGSGVGGEGGEPPPRRPVGCPLDPSRRTSGGSLPRNQSKWRLA
eukprot:2112654-Alexandrium_andersonii.AAC.1